MGAAEEDYEHISGLAERLKLEGEDADRFVSDSMKRLGHRPRTVWEDAEPEGGEGGDDGDFFTRKSQKQAQKRTQREVSTSRNRGDWQYGG